MDTDNLKYVVGSAKCGEPAYVRLFEPLNACSSSRLVDELLWLQDDVKPSRIVFLINSEGGSVLHGMSVFSVLMSCPIEIDCVVEGIAASMASVLWAAGDNLYMHDYSLLMIHNPFASCGAPDPSLEQTVAAFRSQIETVYHKRFGLSREEVKGIMDGEGQADCTFFTAAQAVEAGLLPAQNIIETSGKICEAARAQLGEGFSAAQAREALGSIAAQLDENKLAATIASIHNQNNQFNIQEHTAMNENETLTLSAEEFSGFDAISAQLGFSKDAQLTAMQDRIGELLGAEASLKNVQNELSDLKIQFAGKESELANVKSELEEANASLKQYKDAEKAALEAEIVQTVNAAVEAGKIEDAAKDMWVEMAHANFDLVKSTLASIRGRDNIEQQIASEPENVAHIQDTMTDLEKKMQAEIEARLGKTEFKKF